MSELDEDGLRARLQRAAGDVEGAGDPAVTWQRASHRVAQRRLRRRAASAAAVLLVVAFGAAATLPQLLSPADSGPGVADVESAPEADPEPGAGPEPGPGGEPGAGNDGDTPPGDTELATCRNAEAGFAVDYPARWEAGGSACAEFGPDPPEGERGGAQIEGVAIHGDVLEGGLDRHAPRMVGDESVDDVVASRRVTIDGRRALRWESVSTEESPAAPAGTRSTGWLIELGSERVLVLTTSDVEPDYRERVEALDRMARSVRPLGGG